MQALAGSQTAPLLALHAKPNAEAPSLAELARQTMPQAAVGQASSADASPPASDPHAENPGAAAPTASAKLPHGFASKEEFRLFSQSPRAGLKQAGYDDVEPLIRGSAVTGQKYTTGAPFDVGRRSDFDIALASASLFDKAKALRFKTFGKGTRTGPLTDTALGKLGLDQLALHLSQFAGRDVSFMIYDRVDSVTKRGPSIAFSASEEEVNGDR
jgi:hypothetical protein